MGLVRLLANATEKTAEIAIDVACETVEEASQFPTRVRRVMRKVGERSGLMIHRLKQNGKQRRDQGKWKRKS